MKQKIDIQTNEDKFISGEAILELASALGYKPNKTTMKEKPATKKRSSKTKEGNYEESFTYHRKEGERTSSASSEPSSSHKEKKNYFNVINSDAVAISTYGRETVQKINDMVDKILATMPASSNNEIISIIEIMESGVEDINVEMLQNAIKNANVPSAFQKMLNKIGILSAKDILKKGGDKVQEIIDQNSNNLSKVMQELKSKMSKEIENILNNSKSLMILHDEFASIVPDIARVIQEGDKAVEEAESIRDELSKQGDTVSLSKASQATQKIDLMKSRILSLRETEASIPANLNNIVALQGASARTISDFLNRIDGKFRDIKMSLIQFATANQINQSNRIMKQSSSMSDSLKKVSDKATNEAHIKSISNQSESNLNSALALKESIENGLAMSAEVKKAQLEADAKNKETLDILKGVKDQGKKLMESNYVRLGNSNPN